MSSPESPQPKRKLKIWQIVVLVIVAFGIIGMFSGTDSSTSTSSSSQSSTSNSQSSDPAPTVDNSWIPKGYSLYSDDASVAWRWGTSSETKCSYSSSSCWSMMVVARDGCPTGMYAEIAILDKSGTQIDFTNNTATTVLPNSKVKLTFDTFNEDAQSARLAQINCR